MPRRPCALPALSVHSCQQFSSSQLLQDLRRAQMVCLGGSQCMGAAAWSLRMPSSI